ncbi:glyoxalase [Virgibacillus siamensis]|uniref:glyoxalase n=1 Tax=Virgibacillus siamensis TaxID=480071 RepID=UPI000985E573|nr:glyoxalase [Virgibacillus siamensis]
MKINKVTLQSNNLIEVKDFYVNRFGFVLLDSDEKRFSIKVGESILEFQENSRDSEPFYHFAFNIPRNLFREAKEWTRSKVELNTDDGEDEAHFAFLNANACYFYDPAGNIVEFIARASSPASENNFTVKEILNISEINVTTSDVKRAADQLKEAGVPVRENESLDENSLNFMGEADGGAFILLGPAGRRWIFSDKYSEVHPLKILVNDDLIIEQFADGLKLFQGGLS